MQFKFNRKRKEKVVGVRLTLEEYEFMLEIAKRESVSLMEACGVFIRAAIEEHKSLF